MKILVAISGGVDSAVVAALLKKQGHEIIGVHLKFWNENFQPKNSDKLPANKCCSLEASEAARSVAAKLEIPFYVLNFQKDFKKKVVDYFLATYAKNKTPNPCMMCNREIKFGKLLQKMRELGCTKIATGHYARIRGEKFLRGIDEEKDQSYFLSRLTSKKLKHILFPLGGMRKVEVKKLAQKFGFEKIGGKKESQGTCFFAEKEPRDFLLRNLPKKLFRLGKIRTVDGKVVGKHKGLPLYTIGQRRGVELGGMSEPYFVARFDFKKNELIVAPDRELFAKNLRAKKLSWFGNPPKNGMKMLAQIRYRSPAASGKIFLKKNRISFEFDEPIRAITPGQTVAFYRGQTCLGSGEIC
ncbi:tRNA 2-thiouridine(34) synthase MnmA [Candidatus Gracilibacteria bacterium]|nr:tRNA 2-thiouridine(34) synthase MnmA [Candidatus Gracilibacteria bacterium]MCF7856281.1 tRNA 2-thiouridine(34) synthase MnmA [Candidatus Gracilibacteria bacterium]MCF7896240.1 tRNA 2-thiouridine(34) synthase MnmA [Candidatus Gracilibacteria bacterium]